MFRNSLLLVILLTLPCRANLGDSVAQCVARYGKPVHFTEATDKVPFGTLIFTAAGYGLVVFLTGTTEVGARVSKLDNSAFSATDLQNIMAADTGGSAWTSIESQDPSCLRWTRADHATALYDKDKHVLIFTSEQMSKDLKAAEARNSAAPAATNSLQPAVKAP